MENPADCIAYRYKGNVYLNITNRCPVACIFCIRHADDYHLGRHSLKLGREPEAPAILDAARREIKKGEFGEIVFCGMGEPLMRPEIVGDVTQKLKSEGDYRVRVDTCGLCNRYHGHNIVPELADFIDTMSISLNAGNPNAYAKACPTPWGRDAYYALLDFIVESEKYFEIRLSAVRPAAYHALGRQCPIDLEECKKMADLLGLPLRIRG
ncbi:MAG: TatD family nuclease-associated radical SAM protein [Candidatus Sumerlaeota bacterium]